MKFSVFVFGDKTRIEPKQMKNCHPREGGDPQSEAGIFGKKDRFPFSQEWQNNFHAIALPNNLNLIVKYLKTRYNKHRCVI